MKQFVTGLAALLVTTAAAQAGGIDRSSLPLSVLFSDGNVARLGFSSVRPSVSGDYAAAFGGGNSGNMAESYTSLGFAFKMDLNDRLSAALMMNPSYGADAHYTAGAYAGLEAHWTSDEIAAILKYQLSDRVSAYAGVRQVTSEANIFIPSQMLQPPITPAPIGPYSAVSDSDSDVGYLIGVAYEIPDIALRGSLTYQSAITHSFDTVESFGGVLANVEKSGKTEITLPQSVTLDFQSGIAADTLLFGSVKWAEWSKWHVRPPYYLGTIKDEVTGFDNDVITYQLGIGRKINDNLSLFARLGYEKATGGVASRLSPTDGMTSLGIGGSWTQGNVKVTGGVEYAKLGNAEDASGTKFTGSKAMGVGLSVEVSF